MLINVVPENEHNKPIEEEIKSEEKEEDDDNDDNNDGGDGGSPVLAWGT